MEDELLTLIHSRTGHFLLESGHHGNVWLDLELLCHHPQNNEIWIIALADGQGGRTGGAEAAQLAVRTAIQTALSAPVQKLLSERFWTQLLLDVDKAVSDNPDAGFTTFVGVA